MVVCHLYAVLPSHAHVNKPHSTEEWPSNKGKGGGTPKFLVTLLVLLLHNQLSVILPR